MVKFVSDSSINVLDIPGVDFSIASLDIYTDERSFRDDSTLNLTEMMDYLAAYKGRSYTSCPSTEEWLSTFEGADEVYAVTLTSGLSGTYNSALVARDMYLADHPEAKILVVDSLSVGPEMLVIMEKMIELYKAGKTFEEISEEIHEYQKHTRLFWAFRSLHNLAQNGRVPKIAASAIGIMNLTLTGTASEEGHVKPTGKARGEKKVLAGLLKDMEEAGYTGGKVRICHVENSLLAVRLAATIQTKYPQSDVQITGATGICGYYCERLGIVLSCEC